ncbi:MAG: DUF421 domain-containing protein [Rubricoccaceae bacterium]|nr:DUF421 domain-containing protein [Rubricoccaceae bacterium]
MEGWLNAPTDTLLATVWTAAGVYLAVLVYTRLAGLRSFAKMSGFDFAMTVAIGSVVASSILTEKPALVQAAVALGAIYGFQYLVGKMRITWRWAERLVDNRPLLLMVDGEMLEANMRKARVTADDLWAKLREANVLALDEVRAVVLETTGDISVLHGEAGGKALEGRLLSGVRDAERYDERAQHPLEGDVRGEPGASLRDG